MSKVDKVVNDKCYKKIDTGKSVTLIVLLDISGVSSIKLLNFFLNRWQLIQANRVRGSLHQWIQSY